MGKFKEIMIILLCLGLALFIFYLILNQITMQKNSDSKLSCSEFGIQTKCFYGDYSIVSNKMLCFKDNIDINCREINNGLD
jgi:hypothetical protein